MQIYRKLLGYLGVIYLIRRLIKNKVGQISTTTFTFFILLYQIICRLLVVNFLWKEIFCRAPI